VWVVINAFVRLTTRAGLFEHPLAIGEAWGFVAGWLEHPNVRVVQETEEHARLWSEPLRAAGTGGNLTTEAWIAATDQYARCAVGQHRRARGAPG